MGSGVLQLIKLSLFYLGLCCFLEESPMARPEIHGGRGCLAMTAGRGSAYCPVTLTGVLRGLITFLSLILKHKG